ncbi:MAG: hypothetical protein H0U58_05985 [Chloroflexi bacterium]|nr:hypothetical protein [Chloroflexota bacterium]
MKKVSLDTLRVERTTREMTPRQRSTMERDDELRAAINEAAALPASEAVAIDLKEGQKLPTVRAALTRILRAEPRDLRFRVRGQTIYISRGQIPSGRGRPNAEN